MSLNEETAFHIRVREWTQKQFPTFKKGICSDCGFVGKTHIHHLKYKIPHGSSDIVELCIKCHFLRHRGQVRPLRSDLGKSWMIALMADLAQKSTKKVMPNFSDTAKLQVSV